MPDRGSFTVEKLIIIPYSKSVESYVALGENVEYIRPAFCPDCGHDKINFHGKRKRFAVDGKASYSIFVRRVHCKKCGAAPTLLPSFLLKNQVHLSENVLLALIMAFVEQVGSRGVSLKLDIPRTTIRRWIGKFGQSANHHYRRFLFLKHSHRPQAAPVFATGYPKAALNLFAQLFGLTSGDQAGFGRWVSLATNGCLLYDQPSMAP